MIRLVMVDGQFFPKGPLNNLEGDDDKTKQMFNDEEQWLFDTRERDEAIRKFILSKSDEHLMQLKAEWMQEAKKDDGHGDEPKKIWEKLGAK